MTSLEAFRARMLDKALERGLVAEAEARSYVVAANSASVAIPAARKVADLEGHPNPYHGSILWVEGLGDGRIEVCIGTRGWA